MRLLAPTYLAALFLIPNSGFAQAEPAPNETDGATTEVSEAPVVQSAPRPHGRQALPYLWDYERVEADHANFRPHFFSASLLAGPHSVASVEGVYQLVLPERVAVHAAAGMGLITGHDGEIGAGPGYHAQALAGFPLTDWRGYRTMTVRTSGPEGPVETEMHVPSHRRLVVEAGGLHSTVNFESTQHNTSPVFGLRWWVDWDFEARVGLEDREDRYWGATWLALHAVPTTWAGRGSASGPGMHLDFATPLSKTRQHPVLLRLEATYFPDESYTAAIGVAVPLAHF